MLPEELVTATIVFITAYLVGTACHSYFYERDYDHWITHVIWSYPLQERTGP